MWWKLLLAAGLLPMNVLSQPWPVCSEKVYSDLGSLDMQKMLYNCADNIPGALLPPSYFSISGENASVSDFVSTNVTTQLAMKNLILVADLTSTVQLDFFLRVSWTDPRWNLGDVWDDINPFLASEGLSIAPYVRSENPLNVWLPDLFFYKALQFEVLSELLLLHPGGAMYWARHVFATYSQPAMNFKKYPLDVQNFSFVIQSFAFDVVFFDLRLDEPAVVLLADYQEENKNFLELNQVWLYTKFTSFTVDEELPSPANPGRTFRSGYINLSFERRSTGVIARLVVPIILFMVIVGLSFYADNKTKIDVTLQILLIICAIYLIIGSTIPQIGYLSIMDKFLECIFLTLTLLMGFHFAVHYCTKNEDVYPLLNVVEHMIIFFYRAIWLPMILIFFVMFFDAPIALHRSFLYSALMWSVLFIYLNRYYLRKSIKTSILSLRRKARDESFLQDIRSSRHHHRQSTLAYFNKYEKMLKLTALEKSVLNITETWYEGATLPPSQIAAENRIERRRQSEEAKLNVNLNTDSDKQDKGLSYPSLSGTLRGDRTYSQGFFSSKFFSSKKNFDYDGNSVKDAGSTVYEPTTPENSYDFGLFSSKTKPLKNVFKDDSTGSNEKKPSFGSIGAFYRRASLSFNFSKQSDDDSDGRSMNMVSSQDYSRDKNKDQFTPEGANFLPKRRSDVSIQRSPSHIGYIASEMDDWKVEMRVKMSGEDNSVYVDGIDLITDGVLSV